MRYECQRCDATLHSNDPAHLCKDVRGRLNAYRNERRQHLLRLVRGRRCVVHPAITLRVVCGVALCGMCYIEGPFRPARPSTGEPVDWSPKTHFDGYGQKVAREDAS